MEDETFSDAIGYALTLLDSHPWISLSGLFYSTSQSVIYQTTPSVSASPSLAGLG